MTLPRELSCMFSKHNLYFVLQVDLIKVILVEDRSHCSSYTGSITASQHLTTLSTVITFYQV